jgi:Carboxypeptidase regulatory-like domain
MKGSRIVVFGLVALMGAATRLVAQEGAPPQVSGTVVSAETGVAVGGAWIQLADNSDLGTYSWDDGHFLIPGAPRGPHQYTVDALGYHVATVTLDPTAAAQAVQLTPDPVLLERLDALKQQLAARRNRVGGRVVVFDRQDLAFDPERLASRSEWTLSRFLEKQRLDPPALVCLDEAPGGAEALVATPQSFYLVEALNHGQVLRLYTEDFIRQLITEGGDLGAKATLPFSC